MLLVDDAISGNFLKIIELLKREGALIGESDELNEHRKLSHVALQSLAEENTGDTPPLLDIVEDAVESEIPTSAAA